jgi:hypothetical protein
MSVFGRFLCSINMHKWWSKTRRDFDPERSAQVNVISERVTGQQVEYHCARCGKRRSPEWEMPPV